MGYMQPGKFVLSVIHPFQMAFNIKLSDMYLCTRALKHARVVIA